MDLTRTDLMLFCVGFAVPFALLVVLLARG
jgi:hypothetical protein